MDKEYCIDCQARFTCYIFPLSFKSGLDEGALSSARKKDIFENEGN